VTDITDLRHATEGLRESEAKYRALFESAGDAVFVGMGVGGDMRFSEFNQSALDMFRASRKELTGLAFHDLSPPNQPNAEPSRAAAGVHIAAALEGEHQFFEWRCCRMDGSQFDAEVSMSRLAIGAEYHLLAVARDVTSRKQMERALREEQGVFLSVVQNAPYGVALLDGDNIIYLNPQVTRMLGYRPSEMATVDQAFLQFYPDESYREEARAAWDKALEPEGEVLEQEASVRCKSGAVKEIEFRSNQLGRGRTIVMMADVTERKSIEEALRTMSLIDDLTGLYNRRGFMTLAEQQLKIAERTGRELSLFFADLDSMKWINDTLGHLDGDKALVEAAVVLKEAFRDSDLVARIGGDEFVVLAIDARGDSRVDLAGRLTERLRAHNERRERPFLLSLSVGTASFDPKAPCDLDELLARADAAMYEQKGKKRDSLAGAP